jgi:hypothetical protein
MGVSRLTHAIFATICLLVMGLVTWQGEGLAAAFLPLLRWAVSVFGTHYDLLDLSIGADGGDVIFLAQLNIHSDWVFESATLPADTTLATSTLVAHLLLDVALLLITVFGLGFYRRGSKRVLAMLFVPCVLTVVALDVPIVLVGAANDLVLANFAPGRAQFDVWALGMRLLNHGGRILLAVGLPLLLTHALTHALRMRIKA